MKTMTGAVRDRLVGLLNDLTKYRVKGRNKQALKCIDEIAFILDHEQLDWADLIVLIERNPMTDRMNPMVTSRWCKAKYGHHILYMMGVCIDNNFFPDETDDGKKDMFDHILDQLELENKITRRRAASLYKMYKQSTTQAFERGLVKKVRV